MRDKELFSWWLWREWEIKEAAQGIIFLVAVFLIYSGVELYNSHNNWVAKGGPYVKANFERRTNVSYRYSQHNIPDPTPAILVYTIGVAPLSLATIVLWLVLLYKRKDWARRALVGVHAALTPLMLIMLCFIALQPVSVLDNLRFLHILLLILILLILLPIPTLGYGIYYLLAAEKVRKHLEENDREARQLEIEKYLTELIEKNLKENDLS